MSADLHSLSAPYALDALDEDERALFEDHLADCARCREELAGLTNAASALAFAVESPPPSSALRERILDAARAEPQNVIPFRPRRSRSTSIAASLAAVASVAAVALAVWAVSLHGSLAHARTAVSILGDPTAHHVAIGNAKGELVVASSGRAVLAVSLPRLPKGKTYEAWVANGSVRRAGQFEHGPVVLAAPVAAGAQVMVTVERAGGVDSPTSHPLFAVRA